MPWGPEPQIRVAAADIEALGGVVPQTFPDFELHGIVDVTLDDGWKGGNDGVARLMPGVRRSRRRPDTLIVDRRVARWYVIEVFHLLGYRKRREALGYYAFTRRRHDLRF